MGIRSLLCTLFCLFQSLNFVYICFASSSLDVPYCPYHGVHDRSRHMKNNNCSLLVCYYFILVVFVQICIIWVVFMLIILFYEIIAIRCVFYYMLHDGLCSNQSFAFGSHINVVHPFFTSQMLVSGDSLNCLRKQGPSSLIVA